MAANSNAKRLAELAALVDAVKQRVRNQYPSSTANGGEGMIRVELPDLTPLSRARDAAVGKMAAIGTVNPRQGGLVNNAIQGVKRTISRSLNWFVRDQVTFNRQVIACLETSIETLADVNRTIYALAGQTGHKLQEVRTEALGVSGQNDMAAHWNRWREEWQLKLHKNEVEFLKAVTDLNLAFEQRVTHSEAAAERRASDLAKTFDQTAAQLDANYRLTAKEIEAACQQTALRFEAGLQQKASEFEAAHLDHVAQFDRRTTQLEENTASSLKAHHDAVEQSTSSQFTRLAESTSSSIAALQKSFYADLEKIRMEYERIIHAELRVVRQRLATGLATGAALPSAPVPTNAQSVLPFDYARFAARFRGSEEYVTESQRIYIPYFAGRRHVLDLGCGRGEFLRLMKENGVPAKGIEASDESVAYCRSLGLEAENADLFSYLSATPEASLDGIFCSQVVEHLAPERLPEMVRLCASRLATGGILAVETPNPECLAILATHFYLDPTHTRPVPSQLLAFYMEEFGLGRIEVRRKAPAMESMPEVGELPAGFREKFFDGLDYAIIAYRL